MVRLRDVLQEGTSSASPLTPTASLDNVCHSGHVNQKRAESIAKVGRGEDGHPGEVGVQASERRRPTV